MFVRCSHVGETVGSSILDILPGFLQLEVHYFSFIVSRSDDKGKGNNYIVEEMFEHCVCVMGERSFCGTSVGSHRLNHGVGVCVCR